MRFKNFTEGVTICWTKYNRKLKIMVASDTQMIRNKHKIQTWLKQTENKVVQRRINKISLNIWKKTTSYQNSYCLLSSGNKIINKNIRNFEMIAFTSGTLTCISNQVKISTTPNRK